MKILLDTHVLIWISENNKRLDKKFVTEIMDGRNDVYFSIASLWEISIKKNLGKIDIDLDELVNKLTKMDILESSIEVAHILKLAKLPNYHRDPFDRIIVAQSMVEPMKLYTHDKTLIKYAPDLVNLV